MKLKSMETKSTDQQTQIPESKSSAQPATRPPLPPFTRETAIQKVRLAEDGWNSRDPGKVAKVGEGAGLPADRGTLGPRWQSHCSAFRL